MDWNRELPDANVNLAACRKAAPEVLAAFSAMAQAALKPGALDLRQKELVCIAIGIAKQCSDCIGFHVRAALRAGATREEIAEIAGLAIYMGGGPAYMYAAKAIEACDQLQPA